MKKALLLATAALLSATAAFAQDDAASTTYYKAKESIKSPTDLTSGLYILNVTKGNDKGFVQWSTTAVSSYNDENFQWNPNGLQEIPEEGTTNVNYIFNINVLEGDEGFTIQSKASGLYMSVKGRNGSGDNLGRHNIKPTNGEAGSFEIAKYQMVEIPDEHKNDATETDRFYLQAKNTFLTEGSTKYNAAVQSNTGGLGWTLNYHTALEKVAIQVKFIPVEEVVVKEIPVTVTLPAINGVAVTALNLNVQTGKSVEKNILNELDGMIGGMHDIVIKSNSADANDLIASDANNAFTVEGVWNRELIPDHVYRMCLKPTHNAAAMRYMLLTHEIQTEVDPTESLTRLVPERLWYVKKYDDGSYTFHTLYSPEEETADSKFGIMYENPADHAYATLGEEPTHFELTFLNTGDFTMKVQGKNLYVNDREARFSLWTAADSGGHMRVYALNDDDFETFKTYSDDTVVENVKANPTVDNVLPLVTTFNERNLAAAIRRVGYMGGTDAIGTDPGYYSDPTGKFAENYAAAVALNEKQLAGEEVSEAELADAVAGIDVTNVTFNDIVPGHFYRFKSKVNGKYISSISSFNDNSHKYMDLTTDGTRSNTVWYAQANENGGFVLVNLDEGLVMPKFRSTSGADWTPALPSNATEAASNIQIQYQEDHCFILHVDGEGNTHRHLYGGNHDKIPGQVLASGETYNNDHQWYIEHVTELPVTFFNVVGMDDEYDDDGWSSVYAPVALEVPAEYHVTAYTGVFDGADYTGKPDVNHVHATEIPAQADGKVIIPAGQAALLYYDGTDPDGEDYIQGTATNRNYIHYVNLPIAYDFEGASEGLGNLKGSYTAVTENLGDDFFTLHASHINNFREYAQWKTGYSFIPGFKAYIQTEHKEDEEETMYPIYLINPNTMVAVDGEEGFKYEVSEDNEEDVVVTVTTPSEDYKVYYKQSAPAKQSPMHRVADHTGYTEAAQAGKVHTFTVKNGNDVEYYAYHPESDFQGVTRTVNVDTTGIDELVSEKSSNKVYDLQGRKLAAPAKGFNIINGQKVLVK